MGLIDDYLEDQKWGISKYSMLEIVDQYRYFRVINHRFENGLYFVAAYRNRFCYIFGIWTEIISSKNPDVVWSFCRALKSLRNCRSFDDCLKEVGIRE